MESITLIIEWLCNYLAKKRKKKLQPMRTRVVDAGTRPESFKEWLSMIHIERLITQERLFYYERNEKTNFNYDNL